MTQSLPSGYIDVCCDRCGNSHGEQRYRLNRCWIVTCPECGLSYVNPRADQQTIRSKLQDWADKDVVDSERLRIAFEKNTLNLYQRYIDQLDKLHHLAEKQLLDIGCATGAFMTVARERNWNVKGLELGKASADYANTAQGLTVFNCPIEDFKPDSSFDAITLLEVIEHLESPRQCLLRIHDWLAPGGLLLITTPNFDSLYRRLFGAKWWVVNCEDEHIQFFNNKTLCGLLKETGYTAEYMHIRSIDLTGIFKQTIDRFRNNVNENPSSDDISYYAARNSKERVKSVLERTGLLNLVRKGLKGLDYLFSKPWSPLFGFGEQLIIIARRNP